MGKNPFVWIGKGIAEVAKGFAWAVTHVFGLARKVKYILSAEQPLEKPTIDGLVAVVSDVEELLSESQTAFTDGGLNFPSDSAAYKAFMQLLTDCKDLVPVVEDQLAVLQGKPLPVPVVDLPKPGAAQAAATTPEKTSPAPADATKGPGLDKTVPA